MNHDILQAIGQRLLRHGLPFLRFAMTLACLLVAVAAHSQHDVSLEKTVDRDSVRAGDTVTWTLRLRNENLTNTAGLQVRDTLLPGLTYISHSAPAGTNFDISNGIWMVGQALDANTPELVLTIKTRVEWEGMYMNIAEVVDMTGTDEDSEPNNHELLEDDMDKACVSVPITICSNLNDSVRVTLLPMFTDIQWYKDGVLIPASQGGTQDTFYITEAGLFAFTATQNGCPTLTCCPVVVKDSCYDLALRKTLATGQNSTVNVGDLVQFTLEVFNQGDLPARVFSLIDHVDLDFFAPFSTTNNPPGNTTGDAVIPYTWSNSGTNGLVSLNGELSPGESVQLPVTLKVTHGGQATNFAEIHSDDDRDQDSQPDSQEQDGNADSYTDNNINNANGDEDDHDGATLTILASGLGDYVWNDGDQDGQQDANEHGVPGIIVNLYSADSTLLATDTTDVNGYYFFDDLAPGNYYVEFEIGTVPPGFEPTQHNAGNDATDSDGDPVSGWTGIIKLEPGEVDTTIDFGIFGGEFDLALEKMLAPGQSHMVDIGDDVHYTIKITNEGNLPAYHVDVMDNIPTGLALSPNDPLWTLTANGDAMYVFPGPLLPGQSDSVEIILTVLYGASGQQIVNTAEITSAEDEDGTVYTDLDSTPDNGNPDEDDIDEEEIELEPHDPTGWIYCDKTGRIIPGGHITVTGPNGIPNSQVNIIHDGSEGYYEFYTDGTPGVYTLSYSHPNGFPLSPNCPPSAGPFDPTGLANPVILGVDTLSADYIADISCAANPFYLTFSIAPGDPIILHNNLPVQCILIASIACEDTNNNDMADTGDQPIAGATVNLYNCADPTTPIMTSITDAEGNYRFDGLEPGSYMVGYQLTPDIRPVSGGVIDENGFSPCITLSWGQCDTNTVICLYTCPDVNAGPDIAHCNNTQSSQLMAAVPYGTGTFTWSPTNGLSNPNIANPIATPSASTTYTVTFDDGRGCVDSDAMTIGIGNPFPTLVSGPADTTVDCTSPLVPFEAPTFVDGCDPNLSITLDSTMTTNPCGRTIVRTWTASNDNGNSTSFTQTVTVVDNTPPVMFASHSFFGEIMHGDTLFADCSQIPSLDSLGFSAYDFCSATTHNFTENVTFGNCAVDGFLQSRYCGWTATDACGNTDSLYFTVIIRDTEAPVLAGVPANLTLACGQTVPPVAIVTATDNCGSAPTVSFSQTQTGSGCNQTITRTWSAVDACGNAVSASQTINLTLDNQPPVLANIPANTSGTCGSIPPVPANIVATDNCDTDVEITFSESIAGGNCNYTLTRTWTATDDCGLTTTRTQTISLSDNDAPVLVGLPAASMTASCGSVPAPPAVSATDGCDTNVPVVFNETQTGSGCSFTLTRTWTASDDCNHTTTFTQTINVVDDQGPNIQVTAPAYTWLSHGDTIIRQCNQVFSLNASNAVAVDACCTTPPTMQFHEFVTAGTCAEDGYIQLMNCGWVATDCCGNVDSLFFTVILTDTIAPKLYGVPADVVLACGQTTLPAVPNVVAQDACTSNIPVVFTTTTTNVPGGYVVTRTWTATDGCGNVGTDSQTITVTTSDVVPPVLANVPASLSLDCGAALPPVASGVSATDNCDASPTVTFNETTSGSLGCQTITRTWTATDDAGNSSSASQTITLTDTVPPVLAGVPTNLVAACNNLPAVPVVTATDNCDDVVQVVFNETETGTGCNRTVIRTWTATDNCGNSVSASQTININDVQAPAFVGVLPQNMAVECANLPAPATLTATDNCDTDVAISFNQTQQGSGCNYTLTRTWTATDDCGNLTVAQQILTVADNTPPVMFATHAYFGEIQHGDTIYADCSQIPSLDSIGFSAYDLCGATTTNFTENVVLGSCLTDGFAERRFCGWTATDACGNVDSLYFTVIISDMLPPVILGVPADVEAGCGVIPGYPSIGPFGITATDNCDNAPTITFSQVNSGTGCNRTVVRTWTAVDDCGNVATAVQHVHAGDTIAPVFLGDLPVSGSVPCDVLPLLAPLSALDNCDGIIPVEFDQFQVGLDCDFVLTRVWTATDGCGNTITHEQTVTVYDPEAPVFIGLLPQNDTVACGNVPAPANLIALDNCDADVAVNLQAVQSDSTCDYTLTRTWTALDNCGNVTTHVQVLTVVDSSSLHIEFVNPLLTGLQDGDTLTIPCSNPSIFGADDAVAVDGCSLAPVVFIENGITPGNCAEDGFIVVMHCTWLASDACGNSDTITLHMMVVDNEPPVFSNVPAEQTIGCSDPLPPCGNPTATDACSNVTISSNSITVTTAEGYDRICTWTATDACGNMATATSTLHVVDDGAPIISGVPNDSTIYLASGQTVPNAPTVTATDGCPAQPMPVVFSQTTAPMGNCMTKITRTWTATDGDGNTTIEQQEITVVGFNDAVVSSSLPDTCGMGVGSAILAPASYGYAWSNGLTGASQSGLTAGTYSVTATNNGCEKVLTVVIGNVQQPLTITAINATPESCAGGDGTASIAPANYNYAWSGGGTGATRTGLAAGNYSVTATKGNCSLVFTVNVPDGCTCEPAVLDALLTENTECGVATGSATLDLVGNPDDYDYLWIPNLGTASASGNARTGLPASHYVVLVTYQGDNTCVEKFEFDIFDDCPRCAPEIGTEALVFNVAASPASVCLPVPFAVLSQSVVMEQGKPVVPEMEGCQPDDVRMYGFEALEPGALQVVWKVENDTFRTVVGALGELPGFMNHVDPDGAWYFDDEKLRLVTPNLTASYGKIWVTHLPTGEIQSSKLKTAKEHLGTSIELTLGTHVFIVSNAAGNCVDTLSVTLQLTTTSTPEEAEEQSELQSDFLQVAENQQVTTNVLANDQLRKPVKQLKIAKQPLNGKAWVNVDNTVSYRPLVEYCNTYDGQPLDDFSYEVCFEDGTLMQAKVSVEVECIEELPSEEVLLYPNPAGSFVYLDLSPLAGKSVEVAIFDKLGVKRQSIKVEEASLTPLRITLEGYAAGHYTVLIKSDSARPLVRKLVIGRQ